DRDGLAELDQPREIGLDRLHRHARHRDRRAVRLPALRQRDVDQLRCALRVVVEELVEIAHAIEEQHVRVLGLDRQVLPHHRRVRRMARSVSHCVRNVALRQRHCRRPSEPEAGAGVEPRLRAAAPPRYDRRMRVAHIESGRHLYGGARQVPHLIGGLGKEGVDNVLVCPRGAAIAAEARALCRVVELPLRGDLDVAAPLRLRAALATIAPDIVHVHSRRGADLYGGLASIGAPWRAVLTRRVDHREWPPWARRKYAPYDVVIAISSAIESELVEHVGVPRARVRRVPSGVPLAEGSAGAPGLPERPFGNDGAPDDTDTPRAAARGGLRASPALPHEARFAGVVAQLIPRKGHRVLLRALADVLARLPRWHVVLLGRGPLERTIRREIAALGLAPRVHL